MKQNFPTAKFTRFSLSALFAVVVVSVLLSSACATLPRDPANATTVSLQAPGAENNSRININVASAQELETLPGVGKVIAERIISHRSQYGPFRRPEHLMMVSGISDQKFRDLRERVTTE